MGDTGYVEVIDGQTDQMVAYRTIDPAPVFEEGAEVRANSSNSPQLWQGP